MRSYLDLIEEGKIKEKLVAAASEFRFLGGGRRIFFNYCFRCSPEN